MSRPYLEITYRQGKPLAAYLYLQRKAGDSAVRSERHNGFVVDYNSDGHPIGVEFVRVGSIDLAALNHLLAAENEAVLSPGDLAPLTAA